MGLREIGWDVDWIHLAHIWKSWPMLLVPALCISMLPVVNLLVFIGKYTLRLFPPLSSLLSSSCVSHTNISYGTWRKIRANLNISTI